MPRFDGTGPNGQGPLTGSRMGKCSNYQQENGNNSSFGFRRGFGRGMGRGRGCRGGMGQGRGFCTNAQK